MLVNLGRLLTIVLIFGVAFYLGFSFANREIISSQKPDFVVTADNGFTQTSLTKIQARPIYGINNGERKIFGEMLFRTTNSDTEILLKLNLVPIKNIRPSDKTEQLTPTSLNLQIAKTCCGGLDYDIQNTGFNINFETKDNQMNASFSGVLNLDLEKSGIDRLLLTAEQPSLFRVIKEDTKDWPTAVTERPAPYFWINL